jgi:serine/threonine protein kinase
MKRDGAFSYQDVLRWAYSLLDALDYLHSQNPPIIHRDIKPQNLKITTRGDIILLDFGLAKLNSDDTQAQLSVFGYSRKYSPLEQIQGTGTDARSDIFALAATMYHLLTGKPPIDVLARASAIVAGNPDPLELASEINAEIPVGIASVLKTSLALNAASRFASAKAVRQALENAVGSELFEKTEEPPMEVLAAIPAEKAVVISPDTEDFPALEAFAAEIASASPQTNNDEVLKAHEISFPNIEAQSPVPEVLPQTTLIVEEATRVSIPHSNKSRYSLAALLVLLSCIGLAAGYFITKENSSSEPEQTPMAQSASSSESDSESNIEPPTTILDSQVSKVSDSSTVEESKQSLPVSTKVSAEKREVTEKKKTVEEPPAPVETVEKQEPAPVKTETARPAPKQPSRRSQPQQNGETRSRIIESPVPDIESIFTGRPSLEGDERQRRQEERRRQRDQMSDEELREFRRQRREQRRRRANGNNFPF